MENRPEELGSQFRFLMPDLKLDFSAPDLIRRKIRPFILRRKKEEVHLDLPEKIEQTVWIEMDEQQQAVYDSVRSGYSGLVKKVEQDGVSQHRMEVLEAILRLRQVCCDPRLIGEGVAGAKIEQLVSDVRELLEENRKVLIFSQFTSMLQMIRKELPEALYLDGSVEAEKRGELVKSFQEDPNSRLFLLSLKAGGIGLNLTAADTVILFDPWWNDAVERQAIDRAHRIGQKKTVFAKRYIVPNSIEEKMLQIKAKKQHLADQLLDFDGELPKLDAHDLSYLLG
jgi:SNF2 family DNA or RNA helicase